MGSPWSPEKEERRRLTVAGRKAVDAYLRALEDRTAVKRRKPKLSIEELEQRRDEAIKEAEQLRGVDRLLKLQEARDWSEKLTFFVDPEPEVDLPALEEAFIKYAADYSSRNEIAYDTWRAMGVDTKILRAAGIKRTLD